MSRATFHAFRACLVVIAVLALATGHVTALERISATSGELASQHGLASTSFGPATSPDDLNAPLSGASIAAGWAHTCALTPAGGVKCWGSNGIYQLGDGTSLSRAVPGEVSNLSSGVAAIVAGAYFNCALTASGGLKCWGDNSSGQLGTGSTASSSVPVDVSGMTSGVRKVAAGGSHACAVTAAGGVKCWGSNFSGQLGDGTTTDRYTPVDVVGLSSGVVDVAAGDSHTCALTATGALKCWGQNGVGQLGDGTNIRRLTPVDVVGLDSGVAQAAAGTMHTCAITTTGRAKCWGYNDEGQLGNGTTNSTFSPQDVVGLTQHGTQIVAGDRHTCARLHSGGLKCWGDNQYGQIGDGTFTMRTSPVDVAGLANDAADLAAGREHTCAILATGEIACWGTNNGGQLGDGRLLNRSTPVEVLSPASMVTSLATGFRHTCAVTPAGELECWGWNWTGQLGDATQINRSIPGSVSGLTSNIAAVAGGLYHTCARTALGGLKCWGSNSRGQLGDGTTTRRTTPVDVVGLTNGIASLTTGSDHSCALTQAGGVKCWGDNRRGQLGDGTTTNRLTAVDVTGLSSNVIAVRAGGSHTCALTIAGGVKCWGDNAYGELGDGTRIQRTNPVDVVGLSSGVTAIATGGSHSCGLTAAGGVKCWGYNYQGQLGDGTNEMRLVPTNVAGLSTGATAITAGSGHSCAITLGGQAWCWGNNHTGQLGDGTLIDRWEPIEAEGLASSAAAMAAGGFHTCTMMSGGRLRCWGSDGDGQLGIGTVVQRATPANVVSSVAESLSINYSSGQPGSYFTVTGWNFPPNSLARISVNGNTLTNSLAVNPSGSFVFYLNTSGAEVGTYTVTVSVNPSASTSFRLLDNAPLRPPEGGGDTFTVPPGIAVNGSTYLPLVLK